MTRKNLIKISEETRKNLTADLAKVQEAGYDITNISVENLISRAQVLPEVHLLDIMYQDGLKEAMKTLISYYAAPAINYEQEYPMSYANEIVNTIGISREEADVLVEECNIRKKINADLDSSYLFEAILGLRLWIQIAMEEKKTESEITYLAGLSIEKTREWIENPEKQMVYVANCHGFGDEYIAEMLHLPVEQVQSTDLYRSMQ